MTEKSESYDAVKKVQDAWSQGIKDFNEIENMEDFVKWAGKNVPDRELRRRARRYERIRALRRNRVLLRSLVDATFDSFRDELGSDHESNLGIMMAPNSQAFSFTKIVDRLLEEDDGEG